MLLARKGTCYPRGDAHDGGSINRLARAGKRRAGTKKRARRILLNGCRKLFAKCPTLARNAFATGTLSRRRASVWRKSAPTVGCESVIDYGMRVASGFIRPQVAQLAVVDWGEIGGRRPARAPRPGHCFLFLAASAAFILNAHARLLLASA